MPAISARLELASTSVTDAPLFRASAAIAAPCLPELRLPMYRTGSIASRVPPADIRNFLPFKSCTDPMCSRKLEMISEVSGNLPTPESSPVKRPVSGCITANPLDLSTRTFSCVVSLSHICGCIAGTKNFGALLALITLVNKSSALP